MKPNSSHIKGAHSLRGETELLFPVYNAVRAQGAGLSTTSSAGPCFTSPDGISVASMTERSTDLSSTWSGPGSEHVRDRPLAVGTGPSSSSNSHRAEEKERERRHVLQAFSDRSSASVLAALLTIFYVTNYKKSVQHEDEPFPSGSQPATSQWARPAPRWATDACSRSRGRQAQRRAWCDLSARPDRDARRYRENLRGRAGHSTAGRSVSRIKAQHRGRLRLRAGGQRAPALAGHPRGGGPRRLSARSRSETVSP